MPDAECSLCHDTAEAGADVRPNHDKCASCHDIDMDKPGEDCLKCHILPKTRGDAPSADQFKPLLKTMYDSRRAARKASTAGQPWDHSRIQDKAACATCHGDVVKGERKNPLLYHRENSAPQDCTPCHAENRQEVQPRNHAERQNWTLTHGPLSRAGAGQLPKCAACHQASSFCDDCHKTEKPRSHTATFRKRGHGFFAEGDRRKCSSCHQTDFCEACHLHSEPSSHTSSFKRSGHCRVCHEVSTAQTSCQVCHQRAFLDHVPVNWDLPPGRKLHDLPQGWGPGTVNMHYDCTVACHSAPSSP